MPPKNAQKLAAPELLRIIESGRRAEFSRDMDSLQEVLQPVRELLDGGESESAAIDAPVRAEFLRLYGFYLTFSGRARNKRDFQDRAKDVVTTAIDIFDAENLPEKSAEAKITLAFCYWNRGEVSEADALLSLVENDFSENKLHLVYLQIRINRLMLLCWSGEFDRAVSVAEEIAPLLAFAADIRLKTMFHFETAILMHRLKRFDEAILHFNESARLAKKGENLHLLALTYNNFSLLYLDLKLTGEAHRYSDLSLRILRKIDHPGWIAHILDSKTLIYLEENKIREALTCVDQSLAIFDKGEDFKGFVAALWTKVRCLIRLDRSEDALNVFAELHRTAKDFIGERAAQKYTEKFSGEIYVLRHEPLLDEVAGFKRSRIRAALIESKGKISVAAQILKLKNHQTLSDILKNQFPDLYKDLGFRRRRRKTDKNKTEFVTLNSEAIYNEHRISRIVLTNKNFSFDFYHESEQFETFYFDKFLMTEKFGIDSGAVIAVVRLNGLREKSVGKNILLSDNENFRVGRIERDALSGVYYITDKNGEPFPFDESETIGEIVGYCPIGETESKFIKFSKI